MLRALQLGDLLCTVPALHSIRAAYPEAHITLIGLPWSATFVERYPALLDAHLAFPGYPGLPEQPWDVEAVRRFTERARAMHVDLLLQMQGDGSVVNPLAAELGARSVAGFARSEAWRPNDALFLDYPDHGHEIARMLALTRHLGANDHAPLDIPVSAEEANEARTLLAERGIDGAYAILHPGARALTRRWPVQHFAAVGDALRARGLGVVVTGTTEEAHLADAVMRAMRCPATSLAGVTSLGRLAALVRDARVLVCNDTGISHLAAATDTPSVVVFSASDPERWAPLDATRHRAVHGERLGPAHFEPASVEAVIDAMGALPSGALDAA